MNTDFLEKLEKLNLTMVPFTQYNHPLRTIYFPGSNVWTVDVPNKYVSLIREWNEYTLKSVSCILKTKFQGRNVKLVEIDWTHTDKIIRITLVEQ
jgi:hypothetical protein